MQDAGKMLKLQMTHQQVYVQIVAKKHHTALTSSVTCSQPFYFFLGCAHKHAIAVLLLLQLCVLWSFNILGL
jgi:hypothetical protein